MKKRNLLCISLCLILILPLISCKNGTSHSQKIPVYNVLKEAYITGQGYNEKLSEHMSKEMFELINQKIVYEKYCDKEYARPLKIDFRLEEVSQKRVKNKAIEKVTYSVYVKDLHNNSVSDSVGIGVKFTIKVNGDSWYITDRDEDI